MSTRLQGHRAWGALVPTLLVAACLHAAVPSPQSHFGHAIGEDRTSLEWSQVVGYFQKLPKASDRILVQELGKTTEGRPFLVAIVSAPDTIRSLDRHRGIQERLADPRKLAEGEAERLVPQGKTVVMITCSIHSTEVASTHSAIELAHRLLTEDTPKHRAILQNVILLLVPSLNPDGVDIVTRWYRKTLGTPHEGTTPPELYQKYVGHDNNRDWYIFSQAETRIAISKLHNVWHPQIVYDVHQQGATSSRMFVPPWLDPVDPNIDPILAQQCNAIGATMAADLTAAGKTGVAINAMYDFWTPARHYQAYHGGLRILSESASARLSSPITVKPEEISGTALGYSPRERSWNHLEPWAGGVWRLRDIIDYQLIAMESLLYQAAVRREDLLRAFHAVGRRAIARTEPYAFVLSARQRDPGAARKLLETLAFGMVEVERAKDAFQAGGRQFPAGSYLVRMQQPYSAFAKTLLERQRYPDLRLYPGGPPKRPYDVTAQTLPLLMGVDVETVPQRFTAALEPAAQYAFTSTELVPVSSAMVEHLPASDTDTWRRVARAWREGQSVTAGEDGQFVVRRMPNGEARPPRIGLYRSHIPVMDEGWTRWLLEEFGFAYRPVRNTDVSGDLRERHDVIVFPEQSAASIHEGYRRGAMPEEFVGGLGEKGAEALRRFAEDGGTLVFLNDSCEYALERLGVKAKNVLKGVASRDFYSPGSLLTVRAERHPLTRGMPEEFAIWNEGSPAFDVSGTEAKAVLRYPDSGVLASGWLLGEDRIRGRAAVVEVPMGKGRAVLFGMRPQYRAQSYLTFKMLFNAFLPARVESR